MSCLYDTNMRTEDFEVMLHLLLSLWLFLRLGDQSVGCCVAICGRVSKMAVLISLKETIS